MFDDANECEQQAQKAFDEQRVLVIQRAVLEARDEGFNLRRVSRRWLVVLTHGGGILGALEEFVKPFHTSPLLSRRVAEASPHTKQTYLAAQFRRLVRVKGKKRALIAVGHSILVIIYHVLKQRASYQELGGDYFDKQNTEKLRARLIRKLESLGVKVTVEMMAEAA